MLLTPDIEQYGGERHFKAQRRWNHQLNVNALIGYSEQLSDRVSTRLSEFQQLCNECSMDYIGTRKFAGVTKQAQPFSSNWHTRLLRIS